MENALDEKIHISTIKEQFIPAEYSLLVEWAPVLEGEVKGSVLLYLQLQTAVDRWRKSTKFGRSNISMRVLCDRCNISRPTVSKILGVLEQYKFIVKESGKSKGESNSYRILRLPEIQSKAEVVLSENIEYDSEKIHENRVLDNLKNKTRLRMDNLDTKGIKNWNCNDLLFYFRGQYFLQYGEKYEATITTRNRGDFKRMIEEYGAEKMKKTIEYAVKQWANINYLNGYPTPVAIFGFRKSLVPEAIKGIISNKGQYSGVEKEVGVW